MQIRKLRHGKKAQEPFELRSEGCNRNWLGNGRRQWGRHLGRRNNLYKIPDRKAFTVFKDVKEDQRGQSPLGKVV